MSSVVFEVKLLGSFGLYRNGKLVSPQKWGIRTSRELLKHLAANCDRIVLDDALLDSLWPQSDVEPALRSLRVRVSELRKLFAQAGPKAANVVERVPGGYRFTSIPGVVEVDVVRFTTAATEALGTLNPSISIKRALTARRLYTGHFLAGDLYDDRWTPERARLQVLWRDVSEKLARYLEDQGDYDAAINVFQSILSPSDPQEEHYRALMLLHYKAGRQTEALRVFEQCQVALDTLYGARPMPETMRLMETIVQQHPLVPAKTDIPMQLPTSHEGAFGRNLRSRAASAYPFLGRKQEVHRLRAALHRLQHGDGGVIWIAGDSGIGKSRLIEEVFRSTAGDSVKGRLLFMRGHGVAHAVPFSTLLDGLQTGLSGVPGARGPSLAPQLAGVGEAGKPEDGGADGEQLLQELFGWVGRDDAQPTAFGSLDPLALQGTWLRQKLLALLQQFAQEQPLVLIVDNADDVDEATWGVLIAVSRFVGELPILLVIASRRQLHVTDVSKALGESVADIEHIALRHLKPAEFMPLIGEGPLTPETRRLLAYLHEQSDGEPFAMTELLRWMEQSQLIHRLEDGTFTVAPRETLALGFSIPPPLPLQEQVREGLDARIANLTRTGRNLLVQGAVLGDSLTIGRWRQLSRLEDEEFIQAFEELLAIGFVKEYERGNHVAIQFSHARLQNHVYHQAPETHRRWIHRQIATLIKQEIGSASADVALPFRRSPSLMAMEVAYHAEAAGELEQACRWSLAAAEGVATRVGSPQAVTLFRHALTIAKKLPLNNRWLQPARRGLAQSLFAAYSFAEAIPYFEQQLAESDFTSVADFEAASQLVLSYMQFQRTDEAQQLASRLLEKMDAFADPHIKGGVVLAMSFLSYRLGDAETAVRQARSSIELLRQSDPTDGRLRLAYRWMALYNWDLSRYGAAIKYARRAVSECRKHGDQFELTRSLNTLGEVYQDLFCVESAQPLHEEALQLATEGEYALLTSEVWRNIGMNFLYKNKSDKAFHALERAWQQMSDLDVSPFWKEIALRALIEAYLLAGNKERVTDLLSQYEQVAGPREKPFVAVFSGALALLKGELATFEAMFAETERFWSQTKRRAREHHVLFFMGRTLIASGAKEQGRAALLRGLAGLKQVSAELPEDLALELRTSRPMQAVRESLDSLGDPDTGEAALASL